MVICNPIPLNAAIKLALMPKWGIIAKAFLGTDNV